MITVKEVETVSEVTPEYLEGFISYMEMTIQRLRKHPELVKDLNYSATCDGVHVEDPDGRVGMRYVRTGPIQTTFNIITKLAPPAEEEKNG